MTERTDSAEIRAKLKEAIGPVCYSDLRAHIARGALFVVDPELALVDAGVAVATDDSPLVGRWIEEGRLRRPSEAELATRSRTAERQWLAIVVQPYVLVQSITS